MAARPSPAPGRTRRQGPLRRLLALALAAAGCGRGCGAAQDTAAECGVTDPAPEEHAPPEWLDGFHVFVYGQPSVEYLQEVGGTAVTWSVYAVGVDEGERAYVEELQDAGIRVFANLPTMQGTPEYSGGDAALAERAACRTLSGDLAEAIWIQPDPPYLPCHNNEEWREFLRDKVQEQADGGADGIHIDEVEGIGGHLYGAGFCEPCMAAFREYLSTHFCAGDLQSRFGVSDVGSFDYGAFLRSSGATALGADPDPDRVREFVRFQLLGRRQQIEEMIRAGREHTDPPVAFSANAVLLHPMRQVLVPLLDLAVYETSFEDLPEGSSLALHALGRALAPGRQMVAFPDILELYQLDEQDWPVVAHWYAEAAASGASLLIPHQAYTYGGGTFHVQAGDMAPFTAWAREVHEQAAGTEPAASVALLYHLGAALQDYYGGGYGLPLVAGSHQERVLAVGSALARAHVPFHVLYVGDGDLVDRPLQSGALQPYACVVLPDPDALDADEQALVAAHEASGAVVLRAEDASDEGLAALAAQALAAAPLPVTTDAPSTVAVVPWAGAGRVVVYLVNYDYDYTSHAFSSCGPLTLQVSAEGLLGTAELLAPGEQAVALEVAQGDGVLSVVVEDLAEAAAVVLR